MNLPLLIHLVLVTLLLAASSTATPQHSQTECVLQSDGTTSCTVSSAINLSVRNGDAGYGPCPRHDLVCWCKQVKDYTNEVRRKNGVGQMLKLGPKSQMEQANRYARKLSSMGHLKHQSLPQATKEVGCKRWVGGENLAYNYEETDIAKKCVDQWIRSEKHFENLIRPWFKEVVAGFHFDDDGRVYCVQTFSLIYLRGTFGSVDGNGCSRVG